MSGNSYTPGPWHFERARVHFSVWSPTGVCVAEVRFVRRPDGTTSADDARLIAAAPDLLAALQKEREWREREAAGELDPEWDYETMVGKHRRNAIAKALPNGEQNG